MNFECDACGRATQHEPALSGEAVPSGWGMREISGHRFFLCPMCGNASHFVGGLSPHLKQILEARHGIKIADAP